MPAPTLPLLQVLRAYSERCSAVYWALLALQLGLMLAIGVGIAWYMQVRVWADVLVRLGRRPGR